MVLRQGQVTLRMVFVCVTAAAVVCAAEGGFVRFVSPVLQELGIGNRQAIWLNVLCVGPVAALTAVGTALVIWQLSRNAVVR
jgi:hypothetical protein